MSTATASVAADVLRRWREAATAAATTAQLDVWLVLSLIAQESAGDPLAWRPEPLFLTRYREGIARTIAGVSDAHDRARYEGWFHTDPQVLATSFGLLQVLVVVAIERNIPLRYPTSLCDPAIGLEAGCRHLRGCFTATATSPTPIRSALLRWNGGHNPSYVDETLAWSDALQQAAR